jgi:predicted permease
MNIWNDFRSGLRQILKQPWSSAFAIGALAVSIGAITALFAAANALLLEPVHGIREPERLIETGRGRDGSMDTISAPLLATLNAPSQYIEGMYAWTLLPVNLVSATEPTRAFGFMVSENYFDLLGVRAERGRLFSPQADAKRGASPHAVISHAAWQRHFGGDPDVVGRNFVLNGQSFTVIGVADRAFRSHVSLLAPDVYVPLSMQRQVQPANGDLLDVVGASWLMSGARLKPGATIDQARAELRARWTAYNEQNPDQGEARPDQAMNAGPLGALPADIAREFTLFSGVMLALVGLVLLIACVNVASMMLARGEARAGELAVRNALGAGRWRLTRMLFNESLLLAIIATGFGVLLARVLLGAVDLGALPTPFPIEVSLDLGLRPLLMSVGAAFLAALVFGMWPAWRSVRNRIDEAARGVVASRSRMREGLVVAQVALTLVLLVASALFLRALDRAHAIELGFRVENVYTADLDLEPTGYDNARQQRVAADIAAAIRANAGVQSVSYARVVPLSGSEMVLGRLGDENTPEAISYSATDIVSDDYFETLGIALEGEHFSEAQTRDGEPVAIVNRTLARALFGEESAIGRSVKYDGVEAGALRIIGVAADSRYRDLSEDRVPFLYVSARQRDAGQYTLFVHTALPMNEVARIVRDAVTKVDANLPKPSPHALADMVALNLLPQRVASTVAGLLGLLGLLLAGIGTYGLIAYFVASRTREIGVRLSMGATPARIERDVLGRGLRLGAVGLGAGLLLAIALAAAVSGMVFGLHAGDLVAFAAAILVLAVAVVAASWLPARRAARISPMTALRHE